MHPITALMSALGVLTAVYVAGWARAVAAARSLGRREPTPATDARFPSLIQILLGAVTNFFDALGIGSFATSTGGVQIPEDGPGPRDPRNIERRPHPADRGPGVHLHVGHPGGHAHAVLDDCRSRAGRLAGGRSHCALVEEEGADRHGSGAACAAATFMLMRNSALFPPGSEEIGVTRLEAGDRGGRQLRAGRADDPRHRALRAVHDPRQPAGDEREDGVPDHDGVLRVPHADRQPAIHPRAELQLRVALGLAHRAGFRDR